MRMGLVVVEVRQHARPQLFEQAQPGLRGGVGGLEQALALGADDGGEERALVGEVVVHQGPGDAGPLGDLVDAHLVIGPLAEHLGAQRQQLVASLAGREPPSRRRAGCAESVGFGHLDILLDTCITVAEAGVMTALKPSSGSLRR